MRPLTRKIMYHLFLLDSGLASILISNILLARYPDKSAMVEGTISLVSIDLALVFSTAFTIIVVSDWVGRAITHQGRRTGSALQLLGIPLVYALLLVVAGFLCGMQLRVSPLPRFAWDEQEALSWSFVAIGVFRALGTFIIAVYFQLLLWKQRPESQEVEPHMVYQRNIAVVAGSMTVSSILALVVVMFLGVLVTIDVTILNYAIILAILAGPIGGGSAGMLGIRRGRKSQRMGRDKAHHEAEKRQRLVSAADVRSEVGAVARVIQVGSCMVCKGALRVGDTIVSCPHCKGIAHRRHLLEWIHVKGSCPACGRHLDEDQVREFALTGE